MKRFSTLINESFTDDDFVDLGLSSGNLWSKYDLGSDDELEPGELFQWGDTIGYDDDSSHNFLASTYKFFDINMLLTKYNNDKENGIVDNKTELDDRDNAVKRILGRNYDMPTFDDFKELMYNTDIEWVTKLNKNNKSISGCKFISKKNKSNFIYVFKNNKGLSIKKYWAKSICTDDYDNGITLCVDFSINNIYIGNKRRISGLNIRPIIRRKKI